MRGGSSGGGVAKSNRAANFAAKSGSWRSADGMRRCRHEYPGPLLDRDAEAPRGVRHHLAQLQPRADPVHPGLSRRVRRPEHAGAQRRRHQGQPVRHDRARGRGRHRAVGPHRRRAGRRPALGHRSLDPDREARRQSLRPRHLRHEGLHRRRAQPRAGLPEAPRSRCRCTSPSATTRRSAASARTRWPSGWSAPCRGRAR